MLVSRQLVAIVSIANSRSADPQFEESGCVKTESSFWPNRPRGFPSRAHSARAYRPSEIHTMLEARACKGIRPRTYRIYRTKATATWIFADTTAMANDQTEAVDDLHVLFIGLGALGSIYSWLLSRSPLQPRITCVARSNYQAVTDAGGVTIKSLKYGTFGPWKPNVLLREGEQGAKTASRDRYDFVIVTAKAILERKMSDSIKPYLRPLQQGEKGPTIVLIQNGIGIEEEVHSALVPSHANGVLSGIAWIGAQLREAGTIVEHGGLERLEVGTFPSETLTETMHPELNSFCELWNSAGGVSVPCADIQPLRWSKIFWNAAWGGACLMARQSVDVVLSPVNIAYTIPVVRRIMLEVLAVARSCGIGEDVLPASSVDQSFELTYSSRPGQETNNLTSRFKPSILVDLEAGRPMELQAIFGKCVQLARRNGVDTPRLDMIIAALAPNQAIALESTGGAAEEAFEVGLPDGRPVGLSS